MIEIRVYDYNPSKTMALNIAKSVGFKYYTMFCSAEVQSLFIAGCLFLAFDIIRFSLIAILFFIQQKYTLILREEK